jgi:hypothetical protein
MVQHLFFSPSNKDSKNSFAWDDEVQWHNKWKENTIYELLKQHPRLEWIWKWHMNSIIKNATPSE